MGLNDIQLSPFVLQELYPHSLVELPGETKNVKKPSTKKFSVLGNNAQNTTVLVSSKESAYLPDEELQFLLTMLSACHLSMESVAILNINPYPAINYKDLNEELKPGKLLLFGVVPGDIQLPIDFPHYQVQQYSGQTYLTAPTLAALQNDKSEKAKLWACLKQIFGV